MLKGLLVALLFLSYQVTTAQPEKENLPLKKIRILSWNIYMLPHLVASHSSKKVRASAIGETLQSSNLDVIFFQEAFHPLARKKILNFLQVKFPFHAGPANRKWYSLKANSGLWVFSKYPIIKSQSIVYKNRYGVDALSRKGALLVELDVAGEHIQIAGTHLQNCGPAWLRQSQCVEFFKRLLKPNAMEGVPQIICGDFNIDRFSSSDEYNYMLRTLDAHDSDQEKKQYSYDRVTNDLHVEKGITRDLIDYILVRDNGGFTFCTNQITPIKKRWSPMHIDLSDHYSLEAEISFSNLNQPAVVSLK